VGLELPLSILSGVVDESEEGLRAGLKALHEAGLLHETGSTSDPEYRFKHQLTHDVAYGNLLHERRRSLHEAVLGHLEVENPSPQGETLDHLAFHAFHGESWERALVYCRRAGERAYLRSSNAEAVEYFRQSLTCLEHLPETRERLADTVDVLFGLRWALWPQSRLAEMGAALREADQLATRLGDLRRQGMVAAYLTDYLWATADNAGALSTGTLALSMAERARDGILAGQARFGLALARSALGHYREAAEIVAQAVGPMEDGPPSHQWRVMGMAKAYLARYLAELGEFDRGISYAESGLEAAESAGDSFALLGLLLGLGTLHLRRADMPAAIVVLARGLETARTRGHVNWVPSLASSLGLAYTLSGKMAEGLDLLAHALTAAESSGIRASQPLWIAYAAEGHVLAGRAASARGLAEQALQLARTRGENGHEAWALRALSNALAQVGSEELDGAIRLMQEAATRAEAFGMRPLMARCQNDLSRMLDRRGRKAAAVDAHEAAAWLWAELGMVGDLAPLAP
jgi:tetratricopeptide (TPR) repeat protein